MINYTDKAIKSLIDSGDIAAMKEASEKLTDGIGNIQRDMSRAIVDNSVQQDKDWFFRADAALKIMKRQRKRLNEAVMNQFCAAKAKRKAAQKEKERIQNELFYAKLKEVLPDAELSAFVQECDRIIDERTEARDD